MIALCFSTSFVVMSPLIDMATSRGSFFANGVPREGCAATHCSRQGERARTARTGASPREDEWGRAGPRHTFRQVPWDTQEGFTGLRPPATRRTYKADP